MAPILSFLIFSGSKRKEHRCVCLSEAKASHSHKMWTKVSSSVPHFLQMGLLLSPIIYKMSSQGVISTKQANNPGLFPIKNNNLAHVARSGPEINSRACLCALQGSRHSTRCCFSIQRFIFLLIFCLETPNKRSGPTNVNQQA